ncbi:TIGR04282 family arsenosugar biosynthesis glycosyltransferase [Streptosporangium sp. NPDC087985]|uniref:TIGR04282 family arsenosugar biosynthesis glycosyltransferase n=1 Tax=Streptosporangium sp. NPDC087985 TaxID=3366196 RepID=UPI0038212380
MTQVLVIAKEPVAGRVKTRLSPPFTPGQSARLAAAALEDTLHAVAATPVKHRVLALDGLPGSWLPNGFTVIPQRGDGLDERLASAFADAHRLNPVPTLLIGMDTPQVTPDLLQAAAGALAGHDAVFGPATDGGFWLLGLRRPDPALLLGVPMSHSRTGAAQLERLTTAGLSVATLPHLNDIDTTEDAFQVAAQVPGSRFAAALGAMQVTDRRAYSPGSARRWPAPH